MRAAAMPSSTGRRTWIRHAMLALTAPALLVGCDTAESTRIDQTRAGLVGSWEREPEAGGDPQARRTLTLNDKGQFIERIVEPSGNGGMAQTEYAGEWSYDGKNLKRRFLQQNGRKFAGGGIRYATFPLVSVEASAFVVEDTVVAKPVRYRRVGAGVAI